MAANCKDRLTYQPDPIVLMFPNSANSSCSELLSKAQLGATGSPVFGIKVSTQLFFKIGLVERVSTTC